MTPAAMDALRDSLDRAEVKLARAPGNAYVTEALHFVRAALDDLRALATPPTSEPQGDCCLRQSTNCGDKDCPHGRPTSDALTKAVEAVQTKWRASAEACRDVASQTEDKVLFHQQSGMEIAYERCADELDAASIAAVRALGVRGEAVEPVAVVAIVAAPASAECNIRPGVTALFIDPYWSALNPGDALYTHPAPRGVDEAAIERVRRAADAQFGLHLTTEAIVTLVRAALKEQAP